MSEGKVQQIGKPHEIYLSPVNKFVANFIGTTNFLDAEIEIIDSDKHATVFVEGAALKTKLFESAYGKGIYSIRPEQIKIKETGDANSALVEGEIVDATFLGESVVYKIRFTSGTLISAHEHSIRYNMLRKIGDLVKVDLNPEEAVIFDESGEEVLNEHKNTSLKETV